MKPSPRARDGQPDGARGVHAWQLTQAGVPITVFTLFFVVPLVLMFALSLNAPRPGVATFRLPLSPGSIQTFFRYPLYWQSAITSLEVAAGATLLALLLGYPIAHIIARANRQWINTALTFIVLVSMQLGLIERMYGMSVLLGDEGLINQAVRGLGLPPTHLMYNEVGVILGLLQLSLPFMVMSLVGVIQSQDPHLEEAARSLGASAWSVLWRIELPLARVGILNGSLLVFAISISSYVVPAVLGGSRVVVLPVNIYQQIFGSATWQLGATVALVLCLITLVFVIAHYRLTDRQERRVSPRRALG
jgi:putative spermidine/putrescine transport system permease protein